MSLPTRLTSRVERLEAASPMSEPPNLLVVFRDPRGGVTGALRLLRPNGEHRFEREAAETEEAFLSRAEQAESR